MKKFMIAAFLLLTAISTMAQLKVYQNGRVRVGVDYFEEHEIGIPENMDTTTQLKVFGPGYMGANPRISLGAQYFKNAKTVMLGEVYSPNDINSDVLWLHGANGFCFTQNSGATDTIFRFDPYESEFSFKYPVRAEGVLLTSDERMKENVRHMDGALETLSELEGVAYNYKPRQSPMAGVVCESPEEQEYKAKYDKYYADMEAARSNRVHYGFIAQDVQKVLPELVQTDGDGMLGVDYIAMIPILVNAVNELSAKNAELERMMGLTETSYAPRQEVSGLDNILTDKAVEVLGQNDPNPFSNDTRIAYNLPAGTQTASIYIYDLQGKQVAQLPVTDMGAGSVTLHGGDLQAGMYIYSLIADGKELASKKMILTK